MNPSEKAELDAFITEYFRDYDSYRATLRLGYDAEDALERAKKLWEHQYVQQAIAEVQENRSKLWKENTARDINKLPDGFEPKDAELDKQLIVSALFREGFYHGSGATHSARVAALCKLAGIYKLEKEEKADGDGRSVMIVPAVGMVDDWELHAVSQQETLKKQVKD